MVDWRKEVVSGRSKCRDVEKWRGEGNLKVRLREAELNLALGQHT